MYGVWSLRPNRTWREVVEKDCQACKLNKEDRNRWMKFIKDVWCGWMFLLVLAHLEITDKGLLNGCVCVLDEQYWKTWEAQVNIFQSILLIFMSIWQCAVVNKVYPTKYCISYSINTYIHSTKMTTNSPARSISENLPCNLLLFLTTTQ